MPQLFVSRSNAGQTEADNETLASGPTPSLRSQAVESFYGSIPSVNG